MAIRMKVLQGAVGTHDPRVLKGSTQEDGITWQPGDEIAVTDELAEKFELSGMAVRIIEKPKPLKPAEVKTAKPEAESAALDGGENTAQNTVRHRQRI